jgi:8-oxo-dGTP diphosphatase
MSAAGAGPAGSYQPVDDAERAYLSSYDATAYPPVAATVDIVLLTIRSGQLCVLLVQRADYPHKGSWALPGGFINDDEDADAAAYRELVEETGIAQPHAFLEQLRTYTDPGRDPRMRVISLAYLALLPDVGDPVAGSDAAAARFWPLADLAKPGLTLAFDHTAILRDGLERAAAKLEYTTLATSFCPPEFTFGELRAVYETVWGGRLDNANLRRKILRTDGFIEAVPGAAPRVGAHGGAPATVYRAGPATWLVPPLTRTSVKPAADRTAR